MLQLFPPYIFDSRIFTPLELFTLQLFPLNNLCSILCVLTLSTLQISMVHSLRLLHCHYQNPYFNSNFSGQDVEGHPEYRLAASSPCETSSSASR